MKETKAEKLREEFENEIKSKVNGVELLFETSAQKYIEWLEEKLDLSNTENKELRKRIESYKDAIQNGRTYKQTEIE